MLPEIRETDMTDIAVRVEALGGSYTNAASETTSTFDVMVVAGVYDEDTEFYRAEDDRPVIPTNGRGAVLILQAYSYNLEHGPDNYFVDRAGDLGMYADNPTNEESLASQVEGLVHASAEKQIVTFIGAEQVKAGLEQLTLEPSSAARYIADAIAIATNYAQRTIPG